MGAGRWEGLWIEVDPVGVVVRGPEAVAGLALGFGALTHRGLALSHPPRPTRCGRSHGCGLPPPSGDPGVLWAKPGLGWATPAPAPQSATGTWRGWHRAGRAGPMSVSTPETRPVRPLVTQAHAGSPMHRRTRQPHRDTDTLTQTCRLQRPSPPSPPRGPKGTSRQKREGAGLGSLDQGQRPVCTRVSPRNCRGRPRGPDPLTLPEKNERGGPRCWADPSVCVHAWTWVCLCVHVCVTGSLTR